MFQDGSGILKFSIEIPSNSDLRAIWVNANVSNSPTEYEVVRVILPEPGTDIRAGVVSFANSQFGAPIQVNFEYESRKSTVIRVEIENQRIDRIYIGKNLIHSFRWNSPLLLFTNIEDLQTGTSPRAAPTTIKFEYVFTDIKTNIFYQAITILGLLFLVVLTWKKFSMPSASMFYNFSNRNILRVAIVGLSITFVSLSTLRLFPQQTDGYFDRNGLGYASAARYSDWYQLSGIAKMSEPYRLGHSNYPPAFLGVFKLIAMVGPTSVLVITSVFSCATIAAIISWVISGSQKKRFFLSLFIVGLSYPFLFAVDRGSSDLIISILIALFTYFVATSKEKTAAATLGLMIALKLFPLLFIPVLFRKGNNRRNVCITMAVSSICTLLGSVFISGSLNQISYFFQESVTVQNAVATNQQLAARSTSIIQWAYNLKSFRVPFGNGTVLPNFSTDLITLIIILIIIIAGIAIFDKSFLQSELLLLLSIVSLLITPISNDYRLLLLIPFVAYWIFEHEHYEFKLHFVVLLGILFSVRPLLWVENSAQTLGGLFTMPILLAVFVAVIRNRQNGNSSSVFVQQSQISPGGN